MQTYISTARLVSVHGTTGCVGHLLRSARGFRAFDASDKEIGVFETAGLGLVALQSWSRKSERGDKWSFCLTAGTLCPANQERP